MVVEGGGLMAAATLTFNGLTVGGGGLDVVELEGVWESPDVRTSDVERSRAHGLWPGVDLLGGRAVTATVQANADLSDQLWVDVQEALRPTGDELPLTVELSGFAGGRVLRSNCRVRRVAVPVDVDRYQFGVARLVVEWFATDPRFYDDSATEESVTIASPTGTGLAFDATFDLSFGGPLPSGVVSVDNEGNFAAPWVVEFLGPVTDPRIELVSTGRTLSFSGSVGGGQTLTVDSLTKSVTLGGSSRYSWLLPGSQWFDLAPGVNQVRLAASAGSGSGTLTFRSAWI